MLDRGSKVAFSQRRGDGLVVGSSGLLDISSVLHLIRTMLAQKSASRRNRGHHDDDATSVWELDAGASRVLAAYAGRKAPMGQDLVGGC